MATPPEVAKEVRKLAEGTLRRKDALMKFGKRLYYRYGTYYTSRKWANEAARTLRELGYLARVVIIKSSISGRYEVYIRRI